MKFDLAKIMRRAWEIKKEEDRLSRNRKMIHNDFSALKESEKAVFGICLAIAWEEAKKSSEKETNLDNVMVIKEWFLNKKFGKEVRNFDNTIEIIKETEKAVYGTVYYNSGTSMEIWVPKSCLC